MKKAIKGLFLILMLDCEQSARLTSESFDRPLSRSEIWALRIHQFCCRSSHRVARQMEMIARAIRDRDPADLNPGMEQMPQDARERIRKRLKDLAE